MSVPLLKHTSDFQAVHLKLWAIHVVYNYIYINFPKKCGGSPAQSPSSSGLCATRRVVSKAAVAILSMFEVIVISNTPDEMCTVFGHIHFYKPALLFTKRSQGRGAKHTSLHNSALDIDHCVRVVTNIFVFIMVPSFITRR